MTPALSPSGGAESKCHNARDVGDGALNAHIAQPSRLASSFGRREHVPGRARELALHPFTVVRYSPDFQTRGADDAWLSLGLDDPRLSSGLVDIQPTSRWFTSLETWKIDRFPQPDYHSFSATDLKRYIMHIHGWLTQWVEKGGNPFIHPRLYRTRFPRCVQDAYTTLSCYHGKTASNE